MDVLLKLISSQNLCKLLTYSSSDPLNEDDISDTTSLLFNKIFPTPRLPDTAEDVQKAAAKMHNSDYGSYLLEVLENL